MYGLFNDESEDYTAENAVEADFYSYDEALEALNTVYNNEDQLQIHLIEGEDEQYEQDYEV